MSKDDIGICLVACLACGLILFILVIIVSLPIACIVWHDQSKPEIYVQDLYVPSLVPQLNGTTTTFNTSVLVDFKFERAKPFAHPHYKYLWMTLYDDKNSTLGTCVIPGFYMGWKLRVHKKAMMEAVGKPWQEAFRAISDGVPAKMGVELVANGLYTVRAQLWVDHSGHMVSTKAIRLYR